MPNCELPSTSCAATTNQRIVTVLSVEVVIALRMTLVIALKQIIASTAE